MLANKIDNESYRVINVDTGDFVGTNIRVVRVKNDEEDIDLLGMSAEERIAFAKKKGLILHVNSQVFKRL